MWKNNLQDGKGKLTWSDKTEYNGEWKKGKKWGKGKFIMSDGSYFEGDFYQNCMHGKGKFQWNDNKIYIYAYNIDPESSFCIRRTYHLASFREFYRLYGR